MGKTGITKKTASKTCPLWLAMGTPCFNSETSMPCTHTVSLIYLCCVSFYTRRKRNRLFKKPCWIFLINAKTLNNVPCRSFCALWCGQFVVCQWIYVRKHFYRDFFVFFAKFHVTTERSKSQLPVTVMVLLNCLNCSKFADVHKVVYNQRPGICHDVEGVYAPEEGSKCSDRFQD